MKLNQGYSYRQVLGPKCLGHNALSYLVVNFNHSSESEWQERLLAGEVLLDNVPVEGHELLQPGQVLVWNRPGWEEADTPQEFGIVYQDAQLLVVDKPSGLPTMPGAGYFLNTLLSFVQREFPTANPLHRLGRATSGLVLFALDSSSAAILTKHWPQIKKQYQALASLVAERDLYDIQTPIGKQSHPLLGTVYAASATGKRSRSVARVLQRRSQTTVFEVDLHTGRPHQIRIHLASIGHPLDGDPLYAAGGLPKTDSPGLPGDAGYWLHARQLTLEHPLSGTELVVQSPVPAILRCDC